MEHSATFIQDVKAISAFFNTCFSGLVVYSTKVTSQLEHRSIEDGVSIKVMQSTLLDIYDAKTLSSLV